MRILVCGGREFDDWTLFYNTMYDFINVTCTPTNNVVIIHGDAKGADFCARLFAKACGIEEVRFPANWKKFGLRAGPIRNQQMLDEGQPDYIIAFPGGTGTNDMVTKAKKAGIPVHRVEFIKEDG